MPVRFIKPLFFTLLLFVVGLDTWGQNSSQFPPGTLTTYTSNDTTNNAFSRVTVIFFEIPETETNPIYIAINSPGLGASLNDSGGYQGGGDGTNFYIIGGNGALTDSYSRRLDYTGVESNARNGTVLFSQTYGAEVGWYYLGPVLASQGEKIGNKYYFKIVAEKLLFAPTRTNSFQLDVSYTNSGNPTGSNSIKSFAYSWPIYFQAASNAYIYVPDSDRIAGNEVAISAYDFDAVTTSTVRYFDSTNAGITPLTTGAGSDGGKFFTTSQPIPSAIRGDQTWIFGMPSNPGNGSILFAYGSSANIASYNTTARPSVPPNYNDGKLYRIYSSPYQPAVAVKVKLNPTTSSNILTGAYPTFGKTISMQIVDSSGNPVPYSYNVRVNVSGGTATVDGTAGGKLITTDTSGIATFVVSDSIMEPVTVSLITDGTSGSTTIGGTSDFDDTATLSFVSNPLPTISSASNISLTSGSTIPSSLITINANGGTTVTATNELRIRIPNSLTNTSFNTGILSITPGLTASAKVSTTLLPYESSNRVAVIDVTTPFISTDTLSISGLQITGGSVTGSGPLELSSDGGITWTEMDSKFVTVNPTGTSYIWSPTAGSTAWGTNGNWVGGTAPSANNGTENIVIAASSGNYPILPSNYSLNTLTINSGATLTLSGFNLTLAGAFNNSGTLKTQGGETLTGFTNDTIHNGTIELTAGGTGHNGISSFANLLVSGGAHTAGGAFSLAGNLSITGGSLVLAAGTSISGNLTITAGILTSGSTLSIAGSLTNSGTFTANSGTVTHTGTGTITGFTGTSSFYNFILNTSGSVTLGGNIEFKGSAGSGGNLTLTSGVLSVGSNTLTLDGDWINNIGVSGFGYSTSTVFFRNSNGDTTHNLSGSSDTTFYNLTSNTTLAASLTFKNLTTTQIAAGGVINLTGSSTSTRLSLVSDSGGSQFNFDIRTASGHTVQYLQVTDCNLISSNSALIADLSPLGSTGSGNDATTPKWVLNSTFTWVGGTLGFLTDWATTTNWDLGAVPGSTDIVIIPNTTNKPLLDSARSVKDLSINASSSLDLNGFVLTVSGTFTNYGKLRFKNDEAVTFSNDTSNGGTVEIYGSSGSWIGSPAWTSFNNLTISGGSPNITTNSITLAGNLIIGTGTAANLVQSTGSVSVTGTTTIAVGTATNISLPVTTNSFTGAISVTSVNSLTLWATGALDLGATAVTSNLTVVATGTIGDSGNQSITGTASFETRATAGTSPILINNTNTFGSIIIKTLNAAGTLSVATNAAVSESGATDIAGINSAGTVSVTSTGAITDSGTITATGLTLSAGGAITLDDVSTDIGTLNITARGGATSVTDNAGGMTVSGVATHTTSIDIHALGGTLTVSGAILATGVGTVTLEAQDMAIGAGVTGNGGVTLQPDSDASTIALNDAVGALSLTAAELNNITTAATSILTIGRSTGTGDINIGNSGSANLSGRNYSLTLLGASSIVNFKNTSANDITLRSGGVLIFNNGGNVTSNGTSSTDIAFASSSGTITLTSAGSVGSGTALRTDASILNGIGATGLVNIIQSSAIQLGTGGTALSTNANFTITAGGAITFASTLTVSGAGNDASITSTTGGIALSQNLSVNDQVTLIAQGGGAITRTAGTISATTLDLQTAGGTGTAGTSGAPITTNITNLYGTLTGDLYVNESNSISLGSASNNIASTGGIIDINTGGTVSIVGDVTTTGSGTITITPSTGDINMDTSSLVQSVSGNITLDASANGNVVIDVVKSTSGGIIRIKTATTGTTTEADDTASVETTGLFTINNGTAGAGVGTSGTGAINTKVGQLGVLSTGNIYISNTGGASLQLGSTTAITTSGGLIDITSDGAITTGTAISTTTASGGSISIVSSLGNITTSNAISTGAGGNGSVTFDAGGGTPTITLGANVTSIGSGTINFNDDVILSAGVLVSNFAGSGNITFAGNISNSSARTLGLTAGTGSISVSGTVGSGTALGAVTVNSAAGVTFSSSVNAASFTQSAGTGTTLFSGTQNYSGAFSFTGVALTINDSLTAGTSVTVSNSGTFTKGTTGTITAPSGFTQSGGGSVSLGNNVSTTATTLSFTNAITLTGPVTLASSGGNITSSAQISGNSNLTINAGAGTVGLAQLGVSAGNVANLNALTITSTNTVTLGGAVNVATSIAITGSGIQLNGGTVQSDNANQTITFTGAVTIGSSALTVTSNQGDISFSSTINGPAGGLNLTVTTGATAGNPGDITLNGNIGSQLDILSLIGQDITIGAAVTSINNTGGDTGDNFTISSDSFTLGSTSTVVNIGTGTFAIYPRGTANDIEFGSAVVYGAPKRFYSSDFSGITAAGFTIGQASHTGDIYWTASATLSYNLNLLNSSTGKIQIDSNQATSNTNVTIQSGSGGLVYAAGGTLNLGSGQLLVNSTSEPTVFNVNSTITANGGIRFGGTVDGNSASTRTLVLISSGITRFDSTVGATNPLLSLTTNAGGTTRLYGDITADTQTYNDAVGLYNSLTITAATSAGFVTTLDAAVASTQGLTLSGAGTKTFSGIVGGGIALNYLTQSDGTGTLTFGASATVTNNISLLSDVSIGTFILTSSSGTITIGNGLGDGLTVTGNATLSTSNKNISVDAAIALQANLTASAGNGTITLSQAVTPNTSASRTLTLNTAGTTNLSAQVGTLALPLATLTTDAGGTTNIGGDVYANAITFNDNIALTAPQTWDDAPTNAAGITVAGTLSGAFNLTIAKTGNTAFSSTVSIGLSAGSTSLALSGSGTANFANTATFAGGVSQADGSGAITFQQDVTTGGTSNFDANVTLDGLTFTANGATGFGNTSADTVTLSGAAVTITGTGAITSNAAVSGAQALTLSDSGMMDFVAQVGSPTPLTSITQTGAAGTVTFEDNVTTSGAIALNANVTLDGLTLQSTGSTVDIGNADTDTLSLSTAAVTVQTSNQIITLFSDTSGNQNLTLNSGTAATNIYGDINGGITGLSVSAGTITYGDDNNDDINISGNASLSGTIVTLRGTDIVASGSLGITGTTRVISNLHGNGTWTGTGGFTITAPNVYLDTSTASTLSLGSNISVVGRTVLYRGDFDINNKTLSITGDFVAFGSAYNPNDLNRNTTNASNVFFAYPVMTSIAYYPAAGAFNPVTKTFSTTPNATFAATSGGTITVSQNFYVNGMNMNPASGWILSIPNNTGTTAGLLYAAVDQRYGFGSGIAGGTWAKAFNMTVANCTVPTGVVAAANATGTSSGWNFTTPTISSSRTMYDDLLQVVFSEKLENDSGELYAALNTSTYTALSLRFNAGTPHKFTKIYRLASPGMTGATSGIKGDINDNGDLSIGTELLEITNTLNLGDVGDSTDPLYFWVDRSLFTWNTDASGTGLGSATSTNRSGVHQTNVVDLRLVKGLFIGAASRNGVTNYGENGSAALTSTTDGTRPVLVGAWAGKANKSATAYNGHNFLHMRYSEPMNMSAIASSTVASGGPDTLDDQTVSGTWPKRSRTGAGTLAGSGTVTIAGLNLSYTGDYYSGARTYAPSTALESDPDKTNLIYRNNTYLGEDPAGPHGLTIFMSGYSIGSLGINFPGYLGDPASATNIPTSPVGQTLTQALNAGLLDANGNAVEPTANVYAGKVGGVSGVTILGTATSAIALTSVSTGGGGFLAGFTDGWDLVKPSIPSTGGSTKYIYTVVDSGTGKMSEFHIVTVNDVDGDGVEDTGSVDGIRDSSWNFDSGDSPTNSDETAAFQIGIFGFPTGNGYNSGIATDVNINDLQYWMPPPLSILGPVSISDDKYIKLIINKSTNPYGPLNNMIVSYDATSGFITDWAGNLLSSFTNFEAIERTPPSMNVTLAAVGGKKLFAQFDEPIYHYNGSTFTPVLASDFELYDGSTPTQAVKITILKTENTVRGAGATQILLEFANNSLFTASNLYTLNIRGSVDSGSNSFVVDKLANRIQTTTLFRMTDVGLNIITPIYASDAISNGTFSPNIDPVRVFDGSAGLLGQGTIKIEVGVDSLITPSLPFLMYYGLNVDASFDSSIGSYWSPLTIDGLIKNPYPKAKTVNGAQVGATNKWDFSIGLGTAPKDSSLEFIFELNGLPQGYTPNVDDPTQIRPWGISVGKVIDQRGGVSILNNVINPDVGDKAVLKYSLAKPGQVNIIVFTLDGNIVKVLEKGQKASGDYFLSWDGKNASGKVVARGLYLIRVVGPDFDEYRKVMVVK